MATMGGRLADSRDGAVWAGGDAGRDGAFSTLSIDTNLACRGGRS